MVSKERSDDTLIHEIARLLDGGNREDYPYEKNQYEFFDGLKNESKEFFDMSIDTYNESHRIDEYGSEEDSLYFGDDDGGNII